MIISYTEFLDRRIQRQIQTNQRRRVAPATATIDVLPLAAAVEMTPPVIVQPDVTEAVSGQTRNV